MGRSERRRSRSSSKDRRRSDKDDRKSRRSRSRSRDRERSSRDSRKRRDVEPRLPAFPPNMPPLSSFMPYLPMTQVAPRPQTQGWGRVLPGDWPCPRCTYHNFAGNQSCRKCHTSKFGGDPFQNFPPGREDGPMPFLTTNLQPEQDSHSEFTTHEFERNSSGNRNGVGRPLEPVDISWGLSEETTGVELTASKTWDEHGCRSTTINSWVVQRATHVLIKSASSDQPGAALSKLCGRCLVLELTNSSKQVVLEDLLPFADVISEKDIVLLKTNNSKQYVPDSSKDAVTLSQEAADFLCDKKVRLIGFDALAVEVRGSEDVTRSIIDRDVILLLGLRLLDVLGSTAASPRDGQHSLVCLPLLLEHSEALPARAILLSSTPRSQPKEPSRPRERERESRHRDSSRGGRDHRERNRDKDERDRKPKESEPSSPHKRDKSASRGRSPSLRRSHSRSRSRSRSRSH